MPFPTRAEEEAVERYLRKVRRKRWWDINHQPMFCIARPVQRRTTDMTAWKTRLADPHEIYTGNTDNVSIMRTKGEVSSDQARAEMSGGKKRPPSGSFNGPLAWTDKVKTLYTPENRSEYCLLGGQGGELTSRKERPKRNFDYPVNIYHLHAKEGFVYWPPRERGNCLSRPLKGKNKLAT